MVLLPKRISSENLESSTKSAKQRAVEVRRTAWQSQSFYQTGGWESLFSEYGELSSDSSSVPEKQTANDLAETSNNPVTFPLCPSSQPNFGNNVVFGIVEGTIEKPEVSYLDKPLPLTEEITALSESVKSTEMFRIAGTCQSNNCQHFDGANCKLVSRIVEQLPSVVEALPACQIRSNCRWWQQEGKSACFRCPQVVTDNYYSSALIDKVADPNS